MAIGFGMKLLCGKTDKVEAPAGVIIMEEESDRTDGQLLIFFMLLIAIMVTATGVIDPVLENFADASAGTGMLAPRLLLIALEIALLTVVSLKWFYRSELILWLKKSYSLFILIFPKVLGGIFLAGLLAAMFPLTSYMKFFDANNFSGNFVASLLGALMYFGTIVGVTIVSTLKDFGMHPGPALTLLLSGPAVSLPSIMALVPIIGAKKAAAFLSLVIIFSALSGFIFGITF